MKKSSWIVCCLAVLFAGQIAASAASTNAVYSLTSDSVFKAGKINVTQSHPATALFYSDGTCELDVLGFTFTGTYAKSKNGKQVVLTDTTNKAVLESSIAALIAEQAPGATITVKSVKWSKITLDKTTGAPTKATDTASGKGCETFGSKTKCKSFALKTTWTNWTLISGTNI
jgi:hypothetical protein